MGILDDALAASGYKTWGSNLDGDRASRVDPYAAIRRLRFSDVAAGYGPNSDPITGAPTEVPASIRMDEGSYNSMLSGGFQSKYNRFQKMPDGSLRATFQAPGKHKYDTLGAIYKIDPATGEYVLTDDPTPTRETSSSQDMVRDPFEQMAAFVATSAGMYAGASALAGAGGGSLGSAELLAGTGESALAPIAAGSGEVGALGATGQIGLADVGLAGASGASGATPYAVMGAGEVGGGAFGAAAAGGAGGGGAAATGGLESFAGYMGGGSGGGLGATGSLGGGGAAASGLGAAGSLSGGGAAASPGYAGGTLGSSAGGTAAGASNWYDGLFTQNGFRGATDILSGIYGMSLAKDAREASDPFGPYRGYYGARLAELEANPSLITRQPGWAAGIEAIDRSAAGSGYLGSGNQLAALQRYGGDFYDKTLARYAGFAGANQSPGAGQFPAADLTGQGLASIGYGMSRFMGGGS